MASLKNLTREAIEAECLKCDEMGREAYLSSTGYGPSVRYQLRLNGRSYDSKAIVGSALGLSPKQFSGGAATVVRALERLGFQVREGSKVKSALRRFAAKLGLCAAPVTASGLEPVAYFASGSNRPAEIRGFAAIGADIGVAAPELSENGIRELEALRGSDIQVFVDSGAFSEIAFGAEGPKVVKPISDAEWIRRLDLYERLARALGDQLHVVAPDMVGFQAETLARLALYADRVRAIRDLGARILVPMQRGAMTQAEFHTAVVAILGEDFVPAMPMKKAATSIVELEAFAGAIRPSNLHLLGLGVRNAKACEALEAVERAAPGCLVTMDSNRIAAAAGRSDARPRVLTRAQDFVRDLGVLCTATVKELGVILAFGPFVV